MTKYLISFREGAMVDLSHPDLPAIAKAAGDATQEAMDAGVWVFGGGLLPQVASTVTPDGVVTDGPFPETKEFIGGFAVIDVELAGRGPRVGGQACRGLPLQPGSTGVRRAARVLSRTRRRGATPLGADAYRSHSQPIS